jgi:hypothetical protein
VLPPTEPDVISLRPRPSFDADADEEILYFGDRLA